MLSAYHCLNCRKPIVARPVWARGYPFCSERCADDQLLAALGH